MMRLFSTTSKLLALSGLALAGFPITVNALSETELLTRYQQFAENQKQNPSGFPFELTTSDKKGIVRTEGQIFFEKLPFDLFARSLTDTSEWCEFIPIHLNIKACTYSKDEPPSLRFYVGTKGYLNPSQASPIDLDFNTHITTKTLHIELTADKGPYGTSDYRLSIQSIDVNDGVYVEFDLSSRPGYASLLIDTYFLTVGRHKIGFTKKPGMFSNKPKFVRGEQAASERNVVRYMLAFKVYFQTLSMPEKERFKQRIQRWFDETEVFREQLREMSESAYLSAKQKERRNQLALQHARDNGLPPPFAQASPKETDH